MSIYNNCVCPVCKKQFEDGDDIVVCPECGTPHHRECYNSIHHCANADLHSEGYDFYKENIENKKAITKSRAKKIRMDTTFPLFHSEQASAQVMIPTPESTIHRIWTPMITVSRYSAHFNNLFSRFSPLSHRIKTMMKQLTVNR